MQNDLYTTFHNFRGMDAGWPESRQTAVEETIREITGGGSPLEPAPPVERYRYERIIQPAWVDIVGHPLKNEDVLKARNEKLRLFYEANDTQDGWSDAQHRDILIRSEEYRSINPDSTE